MAYAAKTNVSPEKSQAEIERTLDRYGASAFGMMKRGNRAMVMFEIQRLTVQIAIALPNPNDDEFTTTANGRAKSASAARGAYEQAVRQRWRALLLAIKAKLEAVEAGISTLETEFLPFVVMGDGRTVADHILPELRQHAESGKMPQLLALPEP